MLDDRILLDLYAAAEMEARWTPLLDALCDSLNMRSAVVQVIEEAETCGKETWTARDTRSLADAEAHDRCLNRPDSPRFRGTRGESQRTEITSDLRAFGHANDLMSDLRNRLDGARLGSAMWASFPIAAYRSFSLILHRHPGDMRDASEAEEQFLQRLMPHLQQAVHLSGTIKRLQSRTDLLVQLSSHVQTGLILCHPDLSIDWCNSAAAEILARTDQLSFIAGRVRCARWTDGERLRSIIQAVAAGDTDGGRLVLNSGDGMALHVRVARTANAIGQKDDMLPAAPIALTIALPQARICFDSEDIAGLFGLSPAEAKLAAAVAGGVSISEYAAERSISVGTVRVQLNRTLAKTGTTRQAELVRAVYGSSVARRTAH